MAVCTSLFENNCLNLNSIRRRNNENFCVVVRKSLGTLEILVVYSRIVFKLISFKNTVKIKDIITIPVIKQFKWLRWEYVHNSWLICRLQVLFNCQVWFMQCVVIKYFTVLLQRLFSVCSSNSVRSMCLHGY